MAVGRVTARASDRVTIQDANWPELVRVRVMVKVMGTNRVSWQAGLISTHTCMQGRAVR